MFINLLPVLLLIAGPAAARWNSLDESAFLVNRHSAHYKVNKDGSHTEVVDRELEILKEDARSFVGLTRIQYADRETDFELLEAYTLNGKEKTKAEKKHIEVKPLASRGQGFDATQVVTIAFPKVSIGSKVNYRYEKKVRKPTYPGLFDQHFTLGEVPWKTYEATYESDLPLFWEVHDPEKFLEVTETPGSPNRLHIRLKRPIFRHVIEENDANTDPLSLVWISVSTAKDWVSLPPTTPRSYDEVMKSNLPPALEKIREEAAKGKTEIEQINIATSKLAALIRYVGDWVPVEGAHHPRPINTVVSTGFGDCKDFTSLTGAILRKMGFEAHAAWVLRDRTPLLSPLRRVGAPNFNHAILHVEKNGKQFWIDPTNFTSFAQGLYPDIAGRPALLLKNEKPELREIPPLVHGEAHSFLSTEIDISRDFRVRAKGKYEVKNRAALGLTGKGLSLAPGRLRYFVMDWINEPQNLASWSIPDPKLDSRIVADFSTPFEFEERWRPLQTSAGAGYLLLSPPVVRALHFKVEERVSDLFLGDPAEIEREYLLKGRRILLPKSRECSATSPWIDFSRQIRRSPAGVKVKELVRLRKSQIPVAEIKTPEFSRLQKKARECMQSAVMVVE